MAVAKRPVSHSCCKGYNEDQEDFIPAEDDDAGSEAEGYETRSIPICHVQVWWCDTELESRTGALVCLGVCCTRALLLGR